MRTFTRAERYTITRANELQTFAGELAYYRTHNTFPVVLLGKPITNIYKNINVQVVLTKACNFRCRFCIENDCSKNGAETCPSVLLDKVLAEYKAQGITPHVSITGGEPTMVTNRLRAVMEVVKKHGVSTVNVNTNGFNLSLLHELGVNINLSRHHYLPEKNQEIFRGHQINPVTLSKRVCMQCVMMKGYIDSVAEMKKYMEVYSSSNVGGFSFRGLSTLDAGKEYAEEIAFSKEKAVDIFAIVDQVANDPDFEFVQQKIGDHYWFEMYRYKGKMVRFTYSNFEVLRKVETEERNAGQWFSRATVISPFGKVYAGWTYDINEIV